MLAMPDTPEIKGHLPSGPIATQLNLLVWLIQNVGGTVVVAITLGATLYLSGYDNARRLDEIQATQFEIQAVLTERETSVFAPIRSQLDHIISNQGVLIASVNSHESKDDVWNTKLEQDDAEQLHMLSNIQQALINFQGFNGRRRTLNWNAGDAVLIE